MINHAGINYDQYLHEVNGIRGFMPTVEQQRYMDMLGSTCLTGCEIGTHYGLSAGIVGLAMKRAGLGGFYFCVDPWNGVNPTQPEDTFPVFVGHLHRLEIVPHIVALRGRSLDRDILQVVPDDLDFVYVDGDHDEEPAYQDIVTYAKKLRRGGTMLVHDINNDGFGVAAAVRRAIKDGAILLDHIITPDCGVYRRGA